MSYSYTTGSEDAAIKEASEKLTDANFHDELSTLIGVIGRLDDLLEERDITIDKLKMERDTAQTERDTAQTERDTAQTERDEALSEVDDLKQRLAS